jgi:hypothetical protein
LATISFIESPNMLKETVKKGEKAAKKYKKEK